MVKTKKIRKTSASSGSRIFKIIVIAICSAVLLAAIAARLMHYYRHLNK